MIVSHWLDIERVIGAMRDRTVTPSLILKKLSAYRQQNSLAAALREVGRIERPLFTLRWFDDPALRRTVTAELNKGDVSASGYYEWESRPARALGRRTTPGCWHASERSTRTAGA